MHVNLVWLASLALSLPALSECNPIYIMSAPNLLRVGTPEKVFVEAQNYAGGDLTVKVTVMNHPRKNRELTKTTVTLSKAKNYQALAEVKILDGEFDQNTEDNQYVYVLAEFPNHVLEKVILVSFQSGYIFVQTDKTIYTPASTVLYRVFAMSPGLQPVESGVSVEISTPDGITVEKTTFLPKDGIKSAAFKLPEIVSMGTWKLVARFQNTPQKDFTAEFEVKEYVLPSFEVALKPRSAFFYVDAEKLIVDIEARYLYGKEVTGVGFVVFGVMTKDDGKKTLPGSLQRVEISKGKGVAVLNRGQIQKTFPIIRQIVQASIYISVGVLTETGSEMVEAQKSGIQIVESPYTIHFKKTPKYFKPKMPFDVSIYVTNPDGTPAEGIEVEVTPGPVVGNTGKNGIVKLPVNTQEGVSTLTINVKTKDPQLTDARQAKQQMTAKAYTPKAGSKNYLHIGIDGTELTLGRQVKVNLNLGGSVGPTQDITYLILSKGQLVSAERFKRQGHALVTLSIPVTKDMVPSFRLVAYYHVGSAEVVSDSVWVDVKDTCMGSLEVKATRPRATYEPRKPFSLTITGDPGAKVGLVAVDKGVYVLNNKNRLTQTKVWDIIEKHDTGCTAGSGKDSMGVFYDAGLVFVSSTAGGTSSRTSPTCPSPAKRRRRAVTLLDVTTTLAGKYTGLQKECCMDGMKDNIMGYTCDRRSEFILDGDDCVKAFLHCCKDLSTKQKASKEDQLLLARSDDDDDDMYISSEDIVSRSQFPESWLWEDEILPGCPANNKLCATTSIEKRSFLKDSITSWQITAISLSQTLGICVADPFEMIVIKDFFIDLKLPYSAIRNEQLEIKAILHNYNEDRIKVRVDLLETENVCSSASKRGKYRTTVEMDPMSSRSIPFVIIPMEIGKHTIEVKAAAYDSNQNDGVKKDLLVVAEGVLTKIEVAKVKLIPSQHGGQQIEDIRSAIPKGQVPNTPSSTHITVTGEDMSQTIEAAIRGDGMSALIVQPRGCGEQNMIYMTMPLIATHYLDSTRQWELVGMEKRALAIQYITQGYNQELAFRKKDGSYAAWINRPSSTWLTAYVAKVFAIASDIVSIQENVLCSALKWLVLNKQQPDGMFKEDSPVLHGEMVGNVRAKDSDASLTAFVLIAMQEGSRICIQQVNSLPDSMKKATEYLVRRILTVTNPYALAISSYALANAERFNKDILLKHSSEDGTYWQVPGGHHYTLEATAYALLALVRAKDFEKAGCIVHWLNSQRMHNGGYGTTQSTIMVFQAVAEYRIQGKRQQDIDLEVNVAVSGRSKPMKWKFTKGNAFVSRSDKLQLNQNLTITATGKGEGALSVLSMYYAVPIQNDNECKSFTLDVKFEREDKVSNDRAIESYRLTIETLYLSKDRDSTMTILDISLLTGFIVDEQDLIALSTGKDRYVQKFEMDKQLSEKGSLIVYLDKVSHRHFDKIAFKMHKVWDVGLLQPAGVTVYEYYSPEKRCVKFYHPQKEDGALNRICYKEVCQCAEENCSLQKKQKIEERDREDTACEPGMDYVYKATMELADLTKHTDIYTMKIDQVLKEGTDAGVEGQQRAFMAHPFCRPSLDLMPGKSYLIMGRSTDLPRINGKLQYLLGEHTWIEYWPTQAESQTPTYRERFAGIAGLAQSLADFGCST